MCVGQLGSLLPHVVVPSILAAFLIPEWHLSGAQAGLLAGSGAAGYMLTVPVLATLTDRIDARRILIAGSALSALGRWRLTPTTAERPWPCTRPSASACPRSAWRWMQRAAHRAHRP